MGKYSGSGENIKPDSGGDVISKEKQFIEKCVKIDENIQ